MKEKNDFVFNSFYTQTRREAASASSPLAASAVGERQNVVCYVIIFVVGVAGFICLWPRQRSGGHRCFLSAGFNTKTEGYNMTKTKSKNRKGIELIPFQ